MAQNSQEAIRFAVLSISAKSVDKIAKFFVGRYRCPQVTEGLLLQVRNGMPHERVCHFRFATGEVMVQRGFAQMSGPCQIDQSCAIVSSRDKNAAQLLKQNFFTGLGLQNDLSR